MWFERGRSDIIYCSRIQASFVVLSIQQQNSECVHPCPTYLLSHYSDSTSIIDYRWKGWYGLPATKYSVETSTKPSVSIIPQLIDKVVLETVISNVINDNVRMIRLKEKT
jgi:hypothetical protein